MRNHDDKVFLKRFSGIIVGLVIVAVILIVVANFGESDPEADTNPSRVAMANERTTPVGAVRTELPGGVATEATAQAATAPTEVAAAEPADIDGAAVYNGMCQACHATGAADAPIPGSDLWAERAAKGLDELAQNAINGINTMPPKGGFVQLSDAEVTAAVEHMLQQ